MSSNTSSNTNIGFDIIQIQNAFRYTSLLVGFTLLIGGVLGNILNIIVFIMVRNYKFNACSLYMFVHAFLDLNILFVGLTTRILSTGFQMDFTLTNRIWCKARLGFTDINGETIYTLICLQSIDAFICSSPSVALRQKNIVNTGGTFSCVTTDPIYAKYRSYVVSLGFNTSIPIIVISIFGFLTIRQMRTIGVKRSLTSVTRQMINMALFQIFAVLLFNGPYTAWQIYSLITANVVKDTYRRTIEQSLGSFFPTYGYGPYASSFYCYWLSKRFREQVFAALKWLINGRPTNRVFPTTQRTRSHV